MLSSTLYGKEGTPAMGWNGCVFFKKGNPQAFPARSVPFYSPLSLLRSQLSQRESLWRAGQAGAGLAVLGVLVALTGAAALGRRAHAS